MQETNAGSRQSPAKTIRIFQTAIDDYRIRPATDRYSLWPGLRTAVLEPGDGVGRIAGTILRASLETGNFCIFKRHAFPLLSTFCRNSVKVEPFHEPTIVSRSGFLVMSGGCRIR